MPSKTATFTSGTTTRKKRTTGATQGAGGCKRWYVGYYDGYDHDAYFKSTSLSSTSSWWSDVGKIVSATLTLTVDDGLGLNGDTLGSSGTPKVILRRLTDSFSEGDNRTTWGSGDWTSAAGTPDRSLTVTSTRAGATQVNIDVTAFLEDWAPAKVKRRDGGNGRVKPNYGFGLFGTSYSSQNWAVFSEDESTLTSYRPYLTLVYEYGPTAPTTPTNLAPSGTVGLFGSFAGDFDDVDDSDVLAKSHVQVYASTAVRSGTAAASDDYITVSAHGYEKGAKVWFHSLTGGAGLSTTRPYYVRSLSGTTKFKVSTTPGGTPVNITTNYSALTVASPVYDETHPEGNAAMLAARFDHVPNDLTLARGATYKWRARVYDQEGSVSAWTSLATFVIDNTAPNAPTLSSPADAQSFTTLADATFRGDFTDPDNPDQADYLLAYQVQLSAYPSGDAHWADDEYILWNSGKVYVPSGTEEWETGYGGGALDAGTYYWRARVWDNHQSVSNWAYSSVVVSDDFVIESNDSVNAIQLRPNAPWRIVIRNMYQSDGVTKTTGRGPGQVVAILEDAKNVGASLMYNSPGEAHWTLAVDHPQISVIEPKQTHYAIEFRQGDGWREAYAGLVWNVDATDRDVVFYGIDYLALLDRVVDDRYDPANADRDALSSSGSKYSNDTIKTIVLNQLQKAQAKANSPVGFITVATGNIAAMNEKVTVYSTYQPVLNFVTGLLESHRAGQALNTRISVQKTTTGYKWVVQDNPGTLRENLRMRYGELVQGYRVKPFGDDWATRVDAMGRDKDGLKVRYSSQKAPGIDEATWGRFDYPTFIDGISDGNDLARRARQMITGLSMLGRQMGIGLRSGVLQPRDGYDLMDRFPVEIVHGAIDTGQFGHDEEWVAVGITWQALQRGDSTTVLTLLPKESGSAPSSDLLVAREVSTQAEWQVGWAAPNPLNATARYWLDQSTGKVYRRSDGTLIASGVTGTV